MITLHHAPQSRSFRILWFLHEAGLEHEVRYHAFGGKGLRDPEFLRISPAGRVPVVAVDGITLFESGAILEYLAETRAPDLTRAPGDPERGPFLEWLHYGETLAQHLAQLTFHHIALKPADRSPVVQKLEALRLRRALEGLDAALTGDFLLSRFSAADIMAGTSAELAQRFVPLDGLDRVQAWLERLTKRPAYGAARAADGPPELYLKDFYHG